MVTVILMFVLNNATYASKSEFVLAYILSFVIGLGSLMITFERTLKPDEFMSRCVYTLAVGFLIFQSMERIHFMY